MGIIARQSSWNFVVIYLGVILGTVNNLFLMPNMEPEELGIVSVLLSLMLIGGQIALFGGPQTLMKFYPEHKGEQESGFVNYLIKSVTISLVVSIGLYLLLRQYILEQYADQSSIFKDYYYFFIPLLTLFVYQELFGGYLRSLLRTITNTVVKEVILRLYQSAAFILLITHSITFEVFLMIYVLGYGLTALLFVISIFRHSTFRFGTRFRTKPKGKRNIFLYSAATFYTGIGGAVISNLDVIMIAAIAPFLEGFNGFEQAGVYSRMAFMAMLILIPLRSITNIAVPLISKAWQEDDRVELQSIYSKSALTMTIFGVITFVGIWVNIDSVIDIFPEGKGYNLGKYVFLFLGIGNLINSATGTSGAIIWNSPSYWITTITIPLLALTVVLTNLYTIPRYGMEGAALATTLCRLFFTIVAYVFLLWKYKMQPYTWRNIYVFAVGGGCIYLASFVPRLDPMILDLAVRSILVVILFVPAVLLPRISEDINQQFAGIIAKFGIGKSRKNR